MGQDHIIRGGIKLTLAGYWSQGMHARTREQRKRDEMRNRAAFEQSMTELGFGRKEGETYGEWKRRLTQLFIDAFERANHETGTG